MVVTEAPSGLRLPFFEYGWIDRSGKEVIPTGNYNPGAYSDPIGHFSEGLAWVQDEIWLY